MGATHWRSMVRSVLGLDKECCQVPAAWKGRYLLLHGHMSLTYQEWSKLKASHWARDPHSGLCTVPMQLSYTGQPGHTDNDVGEMRVWWLRIPCLLSLCLAWLLSSELTTALSTHSPWSVGLIMGWSGQRQTQNMQEFNLIIVKSKHKHRSCNWGSPGSCADTDNWEPR